MLDLRRVEPDPAWEAELLRRVHDAMHLAWERADIAVDVDRMIDVMEFEDAIHRAEVLCKAGEW